MAASAAVLFVLGPAVILYCLAPVLTSALYAQKRYGEVLYNMCLAAAANVVLAFALFHWLGLTGIAWAAGPGRGFVRDQSALAGIPAGSAGFARNLLMMQAHAMHLILAGVTRAATTSLFTYLADHPGVCRSSIKETRFFLDHDELKRLYRYEDGPALYDRFFPDCPPDAVRLEATPDYLYRPAVAQRIADTLPNAHLVIILREPISRLTSWRRYAIQNGLLDADMTLTEYVRVQFEAEGHGPGHSHSTCDRSGEGRYSTYLDPWIEAFDRGPAQRHSLPRADERSSRG